MGRDDIADRGSAASGEVDNGGPTEVERPAPASAASGDRWWPWGRLNLLRSREESAGRRIRSARDAARDAGLFKEKYDQPEGNNPHESAQSDSNEGDFTPAALERAVERLAAEMDRVNGTTDNAAAAD